MPASALRVQGQPIYGRTLSEYLAILRRRKWLILLPVLAVPLVALLYSLHQAKVYSASTEVLLSRQDLGSTLAGATNANVYTDPTRFAETQAELARVPEVARRALVRAHVTSLQPRQFLADSSVTPHGNADLVTFTVHSAHSALAARLAAAYAYAFSDYRLELDTANLAGARADLERNLGNLRRQGLQSTQLYGQLTSKAQELRTIELLQTRPKVVQGATESKQIEPRPVRDALLGGVFGLLLGLIGAFVWDSLDKRVRDDEEINQELGIPLLARLPAAGGFADRALIPDDTLDAEAVRRLRANVDFANLDVGAKLILITSAVAEEGKSVTVAKLAVAFARSGRRVVLTDLDLRKPTLHGLFELDLRPGLTDVAIGQVDLKDALSPIPVDLPGSMAAPSRDGHGVASTAGHLRPAMNGGEGAGSLVVLPAGFLPTSPGELVGTRAVAGLLARLRDQADVVLVDAPALLEVSDAVTLSRLADAILVVARLGVINRSMLRELARELQTSPAPKLGFVLTGVEAAEFYGGSYGYTRKAEPEATGLTRDRRASAKRVSRSS